MGETRNSRVSVFLATRNPKLENEAKKPIIDDAQKFVSGLTDFAGATGNALEKFEVIGGKFATVLASLSPIGSFISSIIGVFTPKPESPEFKAIQELKGLVEVRFKQLTEQIDKATKEIKLHVSIHQWADRVESHVQSLRNQVNFLIDHDFSNDSAARLLDVCRGEFKAPIHIAEYVRTVVGEGCKKASARDNGTIGIQTWPQKNNTEDWLQEENDADPVPDTCIVGDYLAYENYDHHAADTVYDMTMLTVAELIAYQAFCVGLVEKTPEAIKNNNEDFMKQIKQILDEMPKIMLEKINGYWPNLAKTEAESLLSSSTDVEQGAKDIRKHFIEKFSWKNIKKNVGACFTSVIKFSIKYCDEIIFITLFFFHHNVYWVKGDSRKTMMYRAEAMPGTPQPDPIVLKKGEDMIIITRYVYATEKHAAEIDKLFTGLEDWLARTALHSAPILNGTNAINPPDQTIFELLEILTSAGTDQFERIYDEMQKNYGGFTSWTRNRYAILVRLGKEETQKKVEYGSSAWVDCIQTPAMGRLDGKPRICAHYWHGPNALICIKANGGQFEED
ncbi:hypothetical protein DdX_20028 [Ditylenchus destructor]|uniref:Uncharacterized protein n=1 Tax=Ditylenchus destructor TaxID=166010 RepID=A0AAD4MH06_9BILA|nr:hypothetical protein DdX_20028 [Ditylenchus destructor]